MSVQFNNVAWHSEGRMRVVQFNNVAWHSEGRMRVQGWSSNVFQLQAISLLISDHDNNTVFNNTPIYTRNTQYTQTHTMYVKSPIKMEQSCFNL